MNCLTHRGKACEVVAECLGRGRDDVVAYGVSNGFASPGLSEDSVKCFPLNEIYFLIFLAHQWSALFPMRDWLNAVAGKFAAYAVRLACARRMLFTYGVHPFFLHLVQLVNSKSSCPGCWLVIIRSSQLPVSYCVPQRRSSEGGEAVMREPSLVCGKVPRAIQYTDRHGPDEGILLSPRSDRLCGVRWMPPKAYLYRSSCQCGRGNGSFGRVFGGAGSQNT
jgi:hypothetical protein